MKYIILFLISFSLFAKDNKVSPHRIRVTPDFDGGHGFQITNEFNLYQGAFYNNVLLEYEIENFSVGAYFNNLPLRYWGNYKQTYTDDSYFGFNKIFNINDKLKISVGSQNGTQLDSSTKQFLNFDLIELIYHNNTFDVGLGSYFVNNALSTKGNKFGTVISLSYKIIPNEFWVTTDWYSGSTNISGSIVNFYTKMNKKVDIYLGIQIPATNSGNEFAGNIGFILYSDK